MRAPTRRTVRRLLAGALLLATACAPDTAPPEAAAGRDHRAPAAAPAVSTVPGRVPSTTPDPASTPPGVPVVRAPERISIPAIGVDAPVIELGLTARGGLEVPDDWDVAGWWSGGAPPGHIGPAVIAGHVDSRTGPAVFYRLDELQPGDDITIHGAEGTSVVFTVERTETFAKSEFPTRRIYGPTPQPTLRLVTCGGPFDASWGHYLDNVVVYARARDA